MSNEQDLFMKKKRRDFRVAHTKRHDLNSKISLDVQEAGWRARGQTPVRRGGVNVLETGDVIAVPDRIIKKRKRDYGAGSQQNPGESPHCSPGHNRGTITLYGVSVARWGVGRGVEC